MAQAFVTTYKNHFRWNNPVKADYIRPAGFEEIFPDNDPELWILPKKADDESTDLARAAALVKQMQKKKYRTTYHVSYCRETKAQHKESHGGVEDSFENELLEYCKKLYGRRNRTILPPLPSLRRALAKKPANQI